MKDRLFSVNGEVVSLNELVKAWLEKFNPNHDELGRFAEGGGSGGSHPNPFGTNKKENIKIAQGIIEDAGIKSTTNNPSGRKVESSLAAIYNNATNEIFVNPNSKFWKDPTTIMQHNFDIGHLSTENPVGVIHHEIAHAKFKAPDNFFSPSHQQLAGGVSKYAKMNPKEFVSEVYAGVKTGKKYSDEIMGLYNQYATPRHSGK